MLRLRNDSNLLLVADEIQIGLAGTGVGDGREIGAEIIGVACVTPRGRPAMVCFRVLPSRNSVAMKARPFSSPMS